MLQQMLLLEGADLLLGVLTVDGLLQLQSPLNGWQPM
jgi:hypothetical protein